MQASLIWRNFLSHHRMAFRSILHFWFSKYLSFQKPTHTHTHPRLTALFPGLPRWAGTRKVKPIWILLKQETVSGSGISWAICKSAPRSRQITMPAPHNSVFYRPDALPATQPTASKHWRPGQHKGLTRDMLKVVWQRCLTTVWLVSLTWRWIRRISPCGGGSGRWLGEVWRVGWLSSGRRRWLGLWEHWRLLAKYK